MTNALDRISERLFGITFSHAQFLRICIKCKHEVQKPEVDSDTYQVVGYCQRCLSNNLLSTCVHISDVPATHRR